MKQLSANLQYDLVSFVQWLSTVSGLHIINLDGKGTHSRDCPVCAAERLANRVREEQKA